MKRKRHTPEEIIKKLRDAAGLITGGKADLLEWSDDVEQIYWVKFDDQTFGIVILRIIVGGDHFVTVKGYINEQLGSRILETKSKSW